MAKREGKRLLDLGSTGGVDGRLPQRVFATDRYPEGRLNVYSRPDILTVARKVLHPSPQWDKLLNSQFGGLFSLPVGKCSHYGKLLHALMCRELVTKKKYEMWTVFGGHPMRFSLVEFGSVTGLSCAEFPRGYDPAHQPAPVGGQKYYWNVLIGDNMRSTLGDVSTLLEDNPEMDMDLKLRLILILIVDGILIAKTQTLKPTFKYVEMLKNVDEFLEFPWGRESFLPTISTLMPPPARTPKEQEEAVQTFRQQLQQQSIRLHGFPLALQLLALDNISGLLTKSWFAKEKRIFTEWCSVGLTKHSMALKAVHAVESSGSLTVEPLLYVSPFAEEGWGEWDDEITDRQVDYMIKLIRKGHAFQKSEWPGGDDSLQLITEQSTNDDCVHKKHVILRKRKTSKDNQPSTSSSVRPSIRSHVNTPTELQMLKEAMESRMEEMQQNFTVKIEEISQDMKKMRRKYQTVKFKRSGVVGSHISKFSSTRRLRRSRLRRSSPRIQTQFNPSHVSPSVEKSGDVIGANNNPDEVLHDPSFSGDILFGEMRHDWKKYVQDIVYESSADEGQGTKEDDTTIEAVQENSNTSQVVRNVDQALTGDNQEKPVSSHAYGVSEVGNALLPTSEMNTEEIPVSGPPLKTDASNVADCMDAAVEGVEGNASTGGEPPIENPPLSHTFGLPIFDTPIKNIGNIPFEVANDDAPIYDTVTKPQTSQVPSTPPNLVEIPEPFAETNPLEAAEQHIYNIEDTGSDAVLQSDEVDTQENPQKLSPTHPVEVDTKENPQILTTTHPVELPLLPLTDNENYQQPPTSNSDEHAGQHVNPIAQESEKETGLHYLIPDGNSNDGCGDTQEGDVEMCELSDSSPPRQKQRRIPAEAESVLVARFLSKPKQASIDILPIVDSSEFAFFWETLSAAPKTKHITRCGYEINHQFILDLATPKQWVTTLHMEVLVSLLGRRHKETLRIQKATIATPFLCNHLQGKQRAFKAAINKSLFRWPEQLVRLITKPGCTWAEDVDTIYVPMIWEDRHWVGLVITLGLWTIHIFDPNTDLYPPKDVRRFIEPIAEMLPHVINAHCIMPLSQSYGLKPFQWTRIDGTYRNVRSGDCGPVAMKFLEIEVSDCGLEKLGVINDELVDEFRKQYAMDVYEEFIAPVYNMGEM